MRWSGKGFPVMYSLRIRSKFLLLPKCIDGVWKWMERAMWYEQYYKDRDGSGGWTAKCWIV